MIGVWGSSIPGRGEILHHFQTHYGDHPASYTMGIGGSFLVGKVARA